MGAHHGGLGAYPPPQYFTGVMAMDPAPRKPGFSPPTFLNMSGVTRLIVTVSPSTFFLQLKYCKL